MELDTFQKSVLLLDTSEYLSGLNVYADGGATCCTEFSAAAGTADTAAGVEAAGTAVWLAVQCPQNSQQ